MKPQTIDDRITALEDAVYGKRRADFPDYYICVRAQELRSAVLRRAVFEEKDPRVSDAIFVAMTKCTTDYGKKILNTCMAEVTQGRHINGSHTDDMQE